jgi:hypothetical protein
MMATFVGGYRVGWMNATMPLARLSVDAGQLNLRGVLGTFSFSPEDVVRVERVMRFPILASGVRIVHVREDIAERVIFWHIKPARVLASLNAPGFSPSASMADAPTRRFPFRIPFLVVAALLWNVPILAQVLQGSGIPGLGTLVSTGLACAIALGILLPTPVRALALHDPLDAKRLRPVLLLIAIIAGIVFSVHLAQLF